MGYCQMVDIPGPNADGFLLSIFNEKLGFLFQFAGTHNARFGFTDRDLDNIAH